MISVLIIFFIFAIFGYSFQNKKNIKNKNKRKIEKEKKEVVSFVKKKLYHNKLDSIHYLHYTKGVHWLQLEYKAHFYEIAIKKLAGVNDYTYKIKELPNYH